MEFREFVRVIASRRWLILWCSVVSAVVALAVSVIMPGTYRAVSEVLVLESGASSALFGELLPELSTQPERSLQTQLRLMGRRTLAEGAIRRLDLRETPRVLMERVTISAAGRTNVVTIQVEDKDPARATRIANALADEYVVWSRTKQQEALRSAIAEVERRLIAVENEAVALDERAQSESDDEADIRLKMVTSTYVMLSEKLEQLRINEQLETGSGTVVTPAVVEDEPIAPRPLLNLVLGLVLGASGALAGSVVWDRLDDRVKDVEEIDGVFDTPKLGVIPFGSASEISRPLAVRDDPGSPRAEAYRVLRNALDFVNVDSTVKTLVVTSTAPSEGKSTISANLAVALAQAGRSVVYVMCDFRRPTSHELFEIDNNVGLSDVLTGSIGLAATLVQPYEDLPLKVLVSGKMPPNPAELLSSDKMKAVVSELAEQSEWIIVDTPPVLAVSDGAAVSRWADAVLVVVRLGHATRAALARSREIMDQVGATVVGVVASVSVSAADSQHGYGYYSISGISGDQSAIPYGSYYWGRRGSRHAGLDPADPRYRVRLLAGFAGGLLGVVVTFWLLDMALDWRFVEGVVRAIS